tara:strand:+ start:361 stop:591 length:231 start_codon:yes stop_codon:yes gene_type:complete
MKKRSNATSAVTLVIAGAGILSFVSLVIMLLWNNILTDVLAVNSITFFQAMGIKVLSTQIFSHKVLNVRDMINQNK